MRPADLLSVADDLVSTRSRKPRQSNLRRAVSTAYYAMFHCLARCCADTLVGSRSADRSRPAWRQVYRALEHGFAKNSCRNQTIIKRFPKDIEDFANTFLLIHEAQQGCRDATYEPSRFPVAVPYPSPHRATPAYVVVTSSDLDTSRNKASVSGLSWTSRNTFVSLQEKRHLADYDPFSQFTKLEVNSDIAATRDAIERFQSVPIKDRRAFAVFVLFKSRPDP